MAITATVTGGLVQLTGNPVFINCTGASVPSGASEYMVLLRTISADGVLQGAPFVDAKEPNASGTAEFDISGILDQEHEVSFDEILNVKIINHATQAFNIQIQPGERYINSQNLLVETWFSVSSVFQMIKGGLSPRQNAMMKKLNETYYSKYIAGHKFLTPRPWGDVIHPSQPIKLWFMPNENKTANFKIQGFYSDNTSQTASTAFPMNPDMLLELNCNPTLHGLSFNPSASKYLAFFDIWLEYSGTPYSDVRRFQVDLAYCERPYFLFFANSLGGIDDVYLSGFGIDAFEVQGTLAYRPVRQSDTVFTPTILSSDKSGKNKWVINSGWKSISTIQFYRDLMLSKQAWFLYPNNSSSHIVVPIIVQNSDTELINRQDDKWNIDIEFIEAHDSRFSFDNRSY